MAQSVPIFVIKGPNGMAVPLLEAYAALCEEAGLEVEADKVETAIHEFSTWQTEHKDEVKQPSKKAETSVGKPANSSKKKKG